MIRRELHLLGDVRLSGDRRTIGRSIDCDVRLEDDEISQLHAVLERCGEGWRLIDQNGSRGLRVNGRKTTDAILVPGDVIDIRPFSMNYLDDRAEGQTAASDRSIHLSFTGVVPTYVRDSQDAGSVIQQRLEDLYAMARLILARKDNGSFWQIMHAALQRCLAADRCVLVGVEEKGGLFRLAPRARTADIDKPLGISQSVLRDTVASGKAMLIQQVLQDERYADARSLVDSRSGSVICVPVMVDGQARAVLYADRDLMRMPFQPGDLDFAMAAVDLAAGAVSVDELQAKTRELSRLKGRIDVGREMQKMLMPSPIPQPAWGEVAALNQPADQMSGDIYDVRFDAKGRLLVSIADVSGKGVPAAFVTAILQSSFRQSVREHEALSAIINGVNVALNSSIPPDCFATMIIVRFSVEGDCVEIVNAGHHAPLWLLRNGNVEEFPDRVGIPLGIMPEWDESVVMRRLDKDSVMVLSSDGMTECANADHEEFGMGGMSMELKKLAQHSAHEVAQGLARQARQHCAPRDPADDVTLVVVKRN